MHPLFHFSFKYLVDTTILYMRVNPCKKLRFLQQATHKLYKLIIVWEVESCDIDQNGISVTLVLLTVLKENLLSKLTWH